MEVKLASNYGFCFGVKRAIKIAEDYKDSATMGPLIHNQDEIDRLKKDFNVGLYTNLSDVKDNDTVITMYESGKVMFQGTSADVDAAMWGVELEKSKDKKTNNNDNIYYNVSAIGSDEVGTGDYFGPIVVTATLVMKDDIAFLEMYQHLQAAM